MFIIQLIQNNNIIESDIVNSLEYMDIRNENLKLYNENNIYWRVLIWEL